MKAYLASFGCEELVDAVRIDVAGNFDGDSYGDAVPIAVGSNQSVVTEDDPLWDRCAILEAKQI